MSDDRIDQESDDTEGHTRAFLVGDQDDDTEGHVRTRSVDNQGDDGDHINWTGVG